MRHLKLASIVVVAALFVIGTAFAIDNEDQLDTVSSCLRDGDLQVERDDFVVENPRNPINIPGLDVERPQDEGHLAWVFFYSDDFEAEKARELWDDGEYKSEKFENILIVRDEPPPADVGGVRDCVKKVLAED